MPHSRASSSWPSSSSPAEVFLKWAGRNRPESPAPPHRGPSPRRDSGYPPWGRIPSPPSLLRERGQRPRRRVPGGSGPDPRPSRHGALPGQPEARRPGGETPRGDSAEHTLVAYNGCLESNLLFRGKLPETIDMQDLKPKVGELRIHSKPPQALVYMDDNLLGPTPVTVRDYDACDMHTSCRARRATRISEGRVDGSDPLEGGRRDPRPHVALRRSRGFVDWDSLPPRLPSKCPDRKTPLPVRGQAVRASREEKHTLVLKSAKVTRTVTVDIHGSETSYQENGLASPRIAYRPAQPSICEFYVDQTFLDYPPINGAWNRLQEARDQGSSTATQAGSRRADDHGRPLLGCESRCSNSIDGIRDA